MKHFRTTLMLVFTICSSYLSGQDISDTLINQGVWFLSSTQIVEIADNEQYTLTEYFKKEDISSIFFDPDKVYTVYSKMGDDVMEDNWKIVDDKHLVMVGPDDGSAQVMDILEINSNKLILQSCNDIEGGITCTKFIYAANKDNWLSDAEIEKLNADSVKEEPVKTDE